MSARKRRGGLRDYLGALVLTLGTKIVSREYRERYEDLLRRGYRDRARSQVRSLLLQ